MIYGSGKVGGFCWWMRDGEGQEQCSCEIWRNKCTCVWGWDMLCRMKGANKERKKMPAV